MSIRNPVLSTGGGSASVTTASIVAAGGLLANGTVPMTGNLDMGGQSIGDLAAITMGSLVLDSTVAVPTPAAGDIGLGAKSYAHSITPFWKDPAGVSWAVQSAFWRANSFALWSPQDGVNIANPGDRISALGTLGSSPALAVTSKYTATPRAIMTTTAAANQGAGLAGASSGSGGISNRYWLGNAAGLGGFYFFCTFSTDTWNSGNSIFVGLTEGGAAVYTSDPSALAFPSIGLVKDAADGVVTLGTNHTTAASWVKTTISASMPVPASAGAFWVALYMYATPNASTIYVRVDDLAAGTTLLDSDTVTLGLTTSQPINTHFMGPYCVQGTRANAIICVTAMNRLYVISPATY